MNCPYCSFGDSQVVDSRGADGVVRRRRQCLACGQRFTTQERVVTQSLFVIKRDGRREAYSREKLSAGILKACTKRPLPVGAIDKVVDDIEAQIYRLGKPEVSTSVIGEMVMEKLKRLDRVAYIRFASVYREFQDVSDFTREVEALERAPSLGQLQLLPGVKARSQRRRALSRAGK